MLLPLGGSMLACGAVGRGCAHEAVEVAARDIAVEAAQQAVTTGAEQALKAAAASDPVGDWVEETGFVGRSDGPEDCARMGGLWHEEQCLRVGHNTVQLLAPEGGAWPTKVRTEGAPGWACELEGWARREGDHLRVVSQDEPRCSLILRITAEGMSVEEDGPCVSFHCGVRGDFRITKATRR